MDAPTMPDNKTIEHLSWRMDLAEREIKLLKDSTDDLRKHLNDIHRTLLQTKSVAIGIGAFYLIDSLGLAAFLKVTGL